MINLLKLTLGYQQLTREKISDNYAWHKIAWTMLEHHPELKERNNKPEKDKGPTPFLSRYIKKQNYVELLLVSLYKPLKPDWCESKQWHLIKVNESYLSQSFYLFDLYANPTRKVKKVVGAGEFSKNGRRLTLMDESAQRGWLVRKGKNNGFEIADDVPLRIEKPVNHYFKRRGKVGLHIGVHFQGGLHVTDREAFKKVFIEGLGTAKGFGFGMLMIKPVHI